jgi:hypothetical protein
MISNPTIGYASKGFYINKFKKYQQSHVYCSTIHGSQDRESNDEWIIYGIYGQ